MNWSLVGSALRLGFFLRVPLLTLLMLAALGPVSQFTGASALLGNLFDQQDDAGHIWGNMFAVSFGAFLLAFTAITTLNLTLHYGALRFSEDLGRKFAPAAAPSVAPPHPFVMAQRRPGLTFTLGTLAACLLIATAIARTGRQYAWSNAGAAVLAFVCAIGMALLAKVVQLALTDARVTAHPPPFLIFPAYRVRLFETWLDALYCWPPDQSQSSLAATVRHLKFGVGRIVQWPYAIVAGAAQGYLVSIPTPDGARWKLRSGHVFALTLASLAFLSYLIVGYNKSFITAAPAALPALAYLLLFLMVLCWTLAALTFFLDRYRFPLFASLLCFGILTARVPQSDYFFRVETARTAPKLRSFHPGQLPTPGAYLTARLADPARRRIVLVATPGGGIQAAAWTAQVLQGLDQRFPARADAAGFRHSVAMISSVSGGSLGSLIYAASFAGSVQPDCVAANARASAIDEVAWGLTTPDFWRAVIPWFRPNLVLDRGWALEQKWAVTNGLSPEPACSFCRPAAPMPCQGSGRAPFLNPVENDTYLSDWAVRGAQIPALLFNSMLVERGQHVVFSTTRFPLPNDPRGIANFYDLYPDAAVPFDVRVNTAARLSASFPYVGPAARPNLSSAYAGDFHFVDGGYYDNLGLDSLVGWLSAAERELSRGQQPAVDVLILQIRHFNTSPEQAAGSRQGWGFQLFAPLSALLHMWNYAPIHRDQNELDLFLANTARAGSRLRITTATVPYCGLDYSRPVDIAKAFDACVSAAGANLPSQDRGAVKYTLANSPSARSGVDCAKQPLSWKLTRAQKGCVEDTWNAWAANDPNGALATIDKFLHGTKPPA